MTLESFCLGCAVFGGTIFALRTALLFLGLGADGADGAGADAGTEVSDGSDSDGTPGADLRIFSVHGVTSFLFLFGLTGWLLLRHRVFGEGAGAATAAAGVALAIGVATMLAIAKIFQLSGRLATDGTILPGDAVGAAGSVYLAIRPGRVGKVQVTARGALKVFDARAKDPAADLPTGTPIVVTAAEDVLIVTKR